MPAARHANVEETKDLMSTIRCHSSSGAPTAGPSSITPALLMSVSSRAKLLDGPLDRGAGLGLVGDIGLDHPCASAVRPDLGGQVVEASTRRAARPPIRVRGQRDRGSPDRCR